MGKYKVATQFVAEEYRGGDRPVQSYLATKTFNVGDIIEVSKTKDFGLSDVYLTKAYADGEIANGVVVPQMRNFKVFLPYLQQEISNTHPEITMPKYKIIKDFTFEYSLIVGGIPKMRVFEKGEIIEGEINGNKTKVRTTISKKAPTLLNIREQIQVPIENLELVSENNTANNTVKSSKLKDFFAKKETKIGLVVLALGLTFFGLVKFKVIKLKTSKK